ncbi:MAG: TetR family transcriptional regulator [Actinomycetota bacterium]|jgi:AcrR family transcriptional regulator|nr:TetR family transcriptional regulator [Actinomycetota bacterium]
MHRAHPLESWPRPSEPTDHGEPSTQAAAGSLTEPAELGTPPSQTEATGHADHRTPPSQTETTRHADVPEPAGLRERKQARTRAQIRAVAGRLFESRGFDAVTVEDICAEVDVSPRTFFRYFHNKDTLVFEGIRSRLEDVAAAFASRPPSEDEFTALCQALLSVAGDPGYEREHLWVYQQLRSSPALFGASLQQYRMFQDELVKMMTARSPGTCTVAVARLLTAVAFGALSATLDGWVLQPDRPLGPQLRAALHAVRHGVSGIVGLDHTGSDCAGLDCAGNDQPKAVRHQ